MSFAKSRRLAVCVVWLGLILPSHAAEPRRVVATGGRIGYTFYTPAAGSTSFWHRTPHKLGGPVAEMQVGFMDWMYTDKIETTNADNDVTITRAWLERASTGQVVPLSFSGSRQLVMPKNSTAPYWLSDAIPSATWTGTAPARDEIFWLHAKGTIPDGGKIPVGTPSTFAGAKFIVYPPANDPGSFDTAGAVPTITGSSARTEGLPSVFLGRFTGPGHLAVIGIGDSVLHGSGDSANPTAVVSGYGFFNRAAVDSNGANTIATFNLTRHGQTAAAWVSPSKQSRQTPFLQFANVVVEEYGTNDLGSAGGGSVASILTSLETIWTTARNAGVQKIVRTKLMPRTVSTDQWAAPANQTPNTGWGDINTGNTGKRDSINAGLSAALAAGKIDVLVDTLSVIADPADNHRWLTNGTNKYTTTDGTHVSPAGNALLGTQLRAALLSLTVDAPPATSYLDWSGSIPWNGADSSMLGDGNHDGMKNLLCYALKLSPLTSPAADKLPAFSRAEIGGRRWLRFSYRERPNASDLYYRVVAGSDLSSWNAVVPNGTSIVREILNPDPDGDGSCALVQIRIDTESHPDARFLCLQVTL